MRIRPLVLMLPLAVLLGCGVPPALAQDATYQWSFTAQKGDVSKFRTYMKLTGRQADDSGDIAIAIRSRSSHTVRDVTAEGQVVYDQADESSEASFNGEKVAPAKSEPAKPITISVEKNGIWAKRDNPNVDPDNSRHEKAILVIQSSPAPDRPVKVGDAWKNEVANPLVRGRKVTLTSTLVGVEKVFGVDALKVTTLVDIPTAGDAVDKEIIKAQHTYYLDAKTHQLLRAVWVIRDPMLPFPANKLVAKVVVNRVLPGVDEAVYAESEKLADAK